MNVKKLQIKALNRAKWVSMEKLAYNTCKNPDKKLCQDLKLVCNKRCYNLYNSKASLGVKSSK